MSIWGALVIAATGAVAILVGYRLGEQHILKRQAKERHPAGQGSSDLVWLPCPECRAAPGPTACTFAGCVHGYEIKWVS